MRTVIVFFMLAVAVSVCDAQWIPVGLAGRGIRDIAIGNNSMFAVTNDSGSVYRSTDRGMSWALVFPKGVSHVAVSATTGTVFALLDTDPPSRDTLYRSTDDGISWLDCTPGGSWIINVEASPVGKIYGCKREGHGLGGAVDRPLISTDDGVSWYLPFYCGGRNISFYLQNIVSLGEGFNDMGSFLLCNISTDNGTTWIDHSEGLPFQTSAAPLWGNAGIFLGETFVGSGRGLFVSTDTCSTWNKISTITPTHLLSLQYGGFLAGTDSDGVFLFSDYGDSLGPRNQELTNLHVNILAFDPAGYVYAGTGSGVWRRPMADFLLHTKRVPQDYPTIQAAINASVNGDTVLVSDGTYYENIRFKGKRIIVASTYLTTGDTSHISHTIINGSQSTNPDSGSVVYFVDGEDTNSVLCGFTITGGTGTRSYDLSIWWRFGGGIYCRNSGARIVDNIITRNRLYGDGVAGGGLMAICLQSPLPFMILDSNRINDNYAYEISAGGSAGGGACLVGANCRVVGNIFERDSVIALQANGSGFCLEGYPPNPLPSALITGNMCRANIAQASLYGAVGAGMLVWGTSEATILENVFENNVGTSASGWAQGGGLAVVDNVTGYGRKLIVKNWLLNNRLTRGGGSWQCGAGVYLWYTMATLNGNEIAGNSTNGTGGGIGAYRSAFRLENNIIARNVTTTNGAGMDIEGPPQVGTEQVMINNTIYDNLATSYGGGMMVEGGANVVSLNNIFWADTASVENEIFVDAGATANVHYCDVQGGWPSGTGNILTDPLLAPGTFHLADQSHCIGAGVDSMQVGGVWYRVPPSCFYGGPRPNPAGSQADIGACENLRATPTGVDDQPSSLPLRFALEQNYPNPFNPSTIIRYALPHTLFVTLTVYNILGQQVAQLVNEQQEAGYHDAVFRGDGLASGVYFYRIQAGDFVASKKLLFLK
jgi:hypothetical protein